MAVDLDKIRAVCDRVAASLGLEVVEVEFRGGAGKQGRVLRIFIDRVTPGPATSEDGLPVIGVTHEDCAHLSREVSTILDVEDAVPGNDYLLEVSSPGLDRKLSTESDFSRFTGSRVKLMTFAPVGVTEKSKGNRHFEGRLERFEGGRLFLDLSPATSKKAKRKLGVMDGQKIEIDFKNVEKANLVPEI